MMKVICRNPIPTFKQAVIEQVAQALGDTVLGLTGTEIARVLEQCKVPDVDPTNTKWKRLANALGAFQNQHKLGNHVVKFIETALAPVNFISSPDRHTVLCRSVNNALAFAGMKIGEDGKVRRDHVAVDLQDALARSNRLKAELRRRNVHEEVIRFCDAEIIANNAFHAVLEAMKSITSKVRALSGLTGDGAKLVDSAFSFSQSHPPLIAINGLQSETEEGEQRGFMNLLKGLYGTFRLGLAHEPKVEWEMSDEDALDILSMISLVHRKLGRALSQGGK